MWPEGVARLLYVTAAGRYRQTRRASPEKRQTNGAPRTLSEDEWEQLYHELRDAQGSGCRAIARPCVALGC